MLASAYGWEPSTLTALTPDQIEYFTEHLPIVEARRHYGVTQLLADFREMFFPRYLDPDPKGEPQEPPRRREPWTVEELLPPFAWLREPEPPMPHAAAVSLAAAYERLPAWAKALAPIDAAKGILAAHQRNT